jgi:hypothetical protein
MTPGFTLTVTPEMPLGELLRFFDLSTSETQPDKPLDEQHLGYLEFLRIDTPNDSRARVRIAMRYDFNLDIQIEAI